MTPYAVLVTGGTGFIGRALVAALKKRSPPRTEIIAIGTKDVDLSNSAQTFEYFDSLARRYECRQLFHLAALYKAGGWPTDHPATQFFVNMSINVNTLEAWRRHMPLAKTTAVLSYCMYPPHDRPHPESELWGTEPEDYLFAYAMTKKAMLVGQRAYKVEHRLSSAAVILPTVFGPGDSFEEDSHVMSALIGKFVRASVNGGKEIVIWGDGSQEREVLFIDDAVDGILLASEKAQSEVINIGTGRAHSLKTIAEILRAQTNFSGRIKYDQNRFVGVRKRLLDVGRAEKELGWKASTTIEEGVRQCVESYRRRLTDRALDRRATDH